jgi:Dehydrogenases (flavoproteins)
MNNHGNYIVSLGNVCRWLATKAEALGVEIYPGFAATEVLYDANGAVAGVATGDSGRWQKRRAQGQFHPWYGTAREVHPVRRRGRGNLGKQLIPKFDLANDRAPQKFGLGLKELWQVATEKYRKGLVQHTFGWPLDNSTGGGSFLYHLDDNLVSVGFVLYLNYSNPYLSPSRISALQNTSLVRDTFDGGKGSPTAPAL